MKTLKELGAKGPKYREPCKVDWDKNLSLLCEAVDQYALQWAKQEMVELSVLSSWKEMVKGQIEERISKLKQNFKQPTGKVLQNVDVKACLSDLHNKYVFVPANKARNNIIIICKRYYMETLIKELGLDNCSTPTRNSAYTSCQMSSEDIVNTHDTFIKCLSVELLNSTSLLSTLGHLGVHRATSIQTFEFSTMYNSISHDLLKSRMNNIINSAFRHKNGATRYTHIKVGRNERYLTSDPLNGDNKYTVNGICKIIEFVGG